MAFNSGNTDPFASSFNQDPFGSIKLNDNNKKQ